jgi:hypothetical protein
MTDDAEIRALAAKVALRMHQDDCDCDGMAAATDKANCRDCIERAVEAALREWGERQRGEAIVETGYELAAAARRWADERDKDAGECREILDFAGQQVREVKAEALRDFADAIEAGTV